MSTKLVLLVLFDKKQLYILIVTIDRYWLLLSMAASPSHVVLIGHGGHLSRLIASFLPSVVDVFNFFSVNKSICFCSNEERAARIIMLRQTFFENLKRGLAGFHIPVSDFVSAMKTDGLCISGGFALGCVTGKSLDTTEYSKMAPRALASPTDLPL